MPPDEMRARNLEAALIVIGRITETGKILLPEPENRDKMVSPKGLFVLKALHVVKGHKALREGDIVRVAYRLPPDRKGLSAETPGSAPVDIQSGNMVIVYVNPSSYPGFYLPVAGGSSVVVIEPSAPGKGASR